MPGTVTLLNPFVRGGRIPGVYDLILARLTALDVPVADPDALAQWVSANYRQDSAWTVMAVEETTFETVVSGVTADERLAVWWGDGASDEIFAPQYGQGTRADMNHNYADTTRRGIVVLGDLAELSTGTTGPRVYIRPESLPESLRRLYLGTASVISGTVLDFPRGVTSLTLRGSGFLQGGAAELPQGLTVFQVMGDAEFTGAVSDLPTGLEVLHLTSSNAEFTGAAADLPRNLTWLHLSGSTILTGAVADLPRQITHLVLSYGNQLVGGLIDLPEHVDYLLLTSAESAISGPTGDLPRAVRYMQLDGGNFITGQVEHLPPELEHLSSYSTSTDLNGDVANIPRTVDYIFVRGTGVLTGDVADLPPLLERLNLYDENVLTGDVADLPSSLEFFDVRGNHTISGDVADLPPELGSFYFSRFDGTTEHLVATTPTVPAGLYSFGVHTALSQASVDNILAGFWAQRDQPKASSIRNINLGGLSETYISPPTDLTVVEQLRNYRSPNNDPQFLPWTVVVHDPPPVPVDLDIVLAGSDATAFPANDVTTHGGVLSLTATEQDGRLLWLFVLVGDDGDVAINSLSPALTLMEQSLHGSAGRIWAGYYVPSQAEVDAGSVTVSFTTPTPERFTVHLLELQNVNTASPAGDTSYDGSDTARAAAGGQVVAVEKAGDYLISILALAAANAASVTTAVTNAQGYSELAYHKPVSQAGQWDEVYSAGTNGQTLDDGYRERNTGDFSYTGIGLQIGDNGTNAYDMFIRLTGVDIPQGATITDARVTFVYRGTTANAGRITEFEWRAVKADNAAAPTTTAEYNAQQSNLTTAKVDDVTTGPYTAGQTWTSANLAPVIQEIVNRPGWQPGNDIVLHGTYGANTNFTQSWQSSTSDQWSVAIDYGDVGEPQYRIEHRLAGTTGNVTAPSYSASPSDPLAVVDLVVRAGQDEGGGEPPPPDPGGEVTVLSPTQPVYQSGVYALPTELPAYETGDTIFAAVFHQSELVPPSGWELVAIQENGSPTAVHYLSVYRRLMPDTTATSLLWEQAASGRLGAAYIIARSNTDVVVVEASAQSQTVVTGSPYDHPAPDVTTTVEGSLVLAFSTCSNSPGVSSPPAFYGLPPAEEALGWVQLTPKEQVQARIAVAAKAMPTPGPVDGPVFQHTSVSAHHTAEVVLVLAPSGEPVEQEAFFVVEAEDFL